MNRLESTAKNMLKIAELKLSSCRFEVADCRKIVIAETQSWGCGALFLNPNPGGYTAAWQCTVPFSNLINFAN
jgi:hypothetical protein